MDNEKVKKIPIEANGKTYKIWTKSINEHPTVKLLILHGGPGSCHHSCECFDDYFAETGYQYIYYDQLGSCYSDHPEDDSLWTLERFVEEVEEVRKAWVLDSDDFYLFGGSWGAMMALEYALKYQEHIKALIISNMQASNKGYVEYAKQVLLPQMGIEFQQKILELIEKGETNSQTYQTMIEKYNQKFFLRISQENLPEGIRKCYDHFNPKVCETLFGTSDFEVRGRAADWSVKNRLTEIKVPTLFITSTYDMADPKEIKWMSEEVQNGYYHLCPNGGHMAPWDDSEIYFKGLIDFIVHCEKKQ